MHRHIKKKKASPFLTKKEMYNSLSSETWIYLTVLNLYIKIRYLQIFAKKRTHDDKIAKNTIKAKLYHQSLCVIIKMND